MSPCECGCGEMARYRYVKGHEQRKPDNLSIEDRGHETPCWIWTKALASNGYGSTWDKRLKKLRSAHCVYYEVHVGPIPGGLDLDHLCRNRACVNPEHLEPVTRRENLLRGETLTAAAAAATHCPQGHAYDEANTYVHPKTAHRTCRRCRRERMSRARIAIEVQAELDERGIAT